MIGGYSKEEHNKWHPKLKKWFASWMPREQCEKCWTYSAPFDMAHSRRRFDIHSIENYFRAAFLCRRCHNWVDHGRKSNERESLILEIIVGSALRRHRGIQGTKFESPDELREVIAELRA